MKSLSLFLILLVVSMSLIPAHAETIQLITKNGNVIPVKIPFTSSNPSQSNNALVPGSAEQNATSVLNGFGYTANILVVEKLGNIIFGKDVVGTSNPLVPYTPTESNANFAAIVLETDSKNTYTIPAFWRQYDFNNSTLVDITQVPPNVLGFSESRTTIGSVSSTIADGIIVSGSGEMIMKLANYDGQSLIIRGDAGTGVAKIVTSQFDLMTAPFTSGLGYLTYTGGNPGTNGINVVAGVDSTHTGKYDYSYYVSGSYHRHHCKCSLHWHGGYTGYGTDAVSTLVKIPLGDHTIITGHTNTGSISNFRLWDTLPATEQFSVSGGTYETNHSFPTGQSYLFVKPNGGTVTVKGETSVNIPLVDITGLPANIPYEISKEGYVGISGVTSATGTIMLTESDVSFAGFQTLGGLLHLYPDSLSHRGPYVTLVLDNINKKTFHTDTGVDQIYTPAAYVKLPIPLDVELDNIKVGSVTMNFLAGNYTAGDEVYVPILPDMKTLDITLNGINAVINIEDLANSAQTKLVSSSTKSDAKYSESTAIADLEISTTTNAIAIASHTGTMNARIDMTVSGNAEFTVNSDYSNAYTQPFDNCQAAMAAYGGNNGCVQHGHPVDGRILAALTASQAAFDGAVAGHKAALEAALTANGPLTVTATIFKNGAYVDKVIVHRDFTPAFTPSSSIGLVSVQNAVLTYGQTSGGTMISLDVESGDYVEFIITASIVASGIPAPVNMDNALVAGFAKGTVNIHSGSVTASMG